LDPALELLRVDVLLAWRLNDLPGLLRHALHRGPAAGGVSLQSELLGFAVRSDVLDAVGGAGGGSLDRANQLNMGGRLGDRADGVGTAGPTS